MNITTRATIIALLKEYRDIVQSHLEDAESIEEADGWNAKLKCIDSAVFRLEDYTE